MIAFSSQQRYHLYVPPCDMRKSFAGLMGLVSSEMKKPLITGEVFMFINRRRDKMKLLVWDRTGFVIYYKWLAEGTFELPRVSKSTLQVQISWKNLQLILEGIQLQTALQRKRYIVPKTLEN